jgi:hypothetical protein
MGKEGSKKSKKAAKADPQVKDGSKKSKKKDKSLNAAEASIPDAKIKVEKRKNGDGDDQKSKKKVKKEPEAPSTVCLYPRAPDDILLKPGYIIEFGLFNHPKWDKMTAILPPARAEIPAL